MSELHALSHPTTQLRTVVEDAKSAVPALVAQIVNDIRDEVPAYAGAEEGDRHRVIGMAVTAAVNQFLDTVIGPVHTDPDVVRLFRDMGFGEAQEGHTLESMRRALRIATRHSWRFIHRVVTAHNLDTAFLGRLGDALFAYIDHLDQEVTKGHELGLSTAPNVEAPHRETLIEALLEDRPESEARVAELEADAASAEWRLPTMLVVMRVSYHGRFPTHDFGDEVLVDSSASPALVIVDHEQSESVAAAITRAGPGLRVAMSWPVAPASTAAADRWTQLSIELVHAGVVPHGPIVRCADHATQLWLHSEPLLRRHLVLELLKPLLAETPNSREILAETMLAWLESRDSAPAIAAKLHVHPQTVRYRWKRINEIFGDLLHDPEFVITVTMLLKATVPMWKAGDTSDIDRYAASTSER